jgi:hypothetical protein
MGSFKFLLNRQKEYVETETGLGRSGRSVLPDDAVALAWTDKWEYILKTAAPIELAKKVLRLIDFIVFLLM